MITIQIDPTWLIDSFEYHEFDVQDRYGKPTYKPSVKVERCRIVFKSEFSRTSTTREVIANGKIYCYGAFTTPLPKFKNDSIVTIDGIDFRIKTIDVYKNITDNRIYSYELSFI